MRVTLSFSACFSLSVGIRTSPCSLHGQPEPSCAMRKRASLHVSHLVVHQHALRSSIVPRRFSAHLMHRGEPPRRLLLPLCINGSLLHTPIQSRLRSPGPHRNRLCWAGSCLVVAPLGVAD